MLRNLKNNYSYSIEYINRQAKGNANAFGLYISSGSSDRSLAQSDLRLKVYQALQYINHYLVKEMLFAIYVDLGTNDLHNHTAFERMCADIRSGSFNQILLIDLRDLNRMDWVKEATCKLMDECEELQCFDLEGNVLQNDCLPMNFLIGV